MVETRKLQIHVIDDDPAVSLLLKTALTQRGHCVLTFPDPTTCPCLMLKNPSCCCPQKFPCTDIVISDINMPNMSGIDFFKTQRAGGCKIPDENKALVSATTSKEKLAAEKLSCLFIKKPFKLLELAQWAEKCAKKIPEDRVVSDLFPTS